MDVGIVDVYTKNDEGKTTRKQFEVDFVVNQGSQRDRKSTRLNSSH